MGVSTDGILAYGWDIPEEQEWPDWFDEESDEYAEQIEARLRAELVGFADTRETTADQDTYFDRQRQADQLLGVEMVGHCSNEYTRYILAAHVISAHRGYPLTIDFEALNANRDEWDAKLVRAAAALGITFDQPPSWLLASYWG